MDSDVQLFEGAVVIIIGRDVETLSRVVNP